MPDVKRAGSPTQATCPGAWVQSACLPEGRGVTVGRRRRRSAELRWAVSRPAAPADWGSRRRRSWETRSAGAAADEAIGPRCGTQARASQNSRRLSAHLLARAGPALRRCDWKLPASCPLLIFRQNGQVEIISLGGSGAAGPAPTQRGS